MPGSVTSVFSEPGDFEAALREEGGLGLLVTGRGQFRARLTQVKLHRMRLSAAGAAVADCLRRGAGRPDPGFAADPWSTWPDLGRERDASGRDHDLRPRPACTLTNRRALPFGLHLVAGPGFGPLRPRVDRSPLRRPIRRKIVAVLVGGWQGATPTPSGRHPHGRSPTGNPR